MMVCHISFLHVRWIYGRLAPSVMHKTTIYLDDHEMETLRALAFLNGCSVAELIRRGVRLVCEENGDQSGSVELLRTLHDKRRRAAIPPEGRRTG